MKTFLTCLILLCACSVCSAWDYVPIEQSRSYNAYRGPVWGGYGYGYNRPYYGGVRRGYGVAVDWPMPAPMRNYSFSDGRGGTWSGYSW